MSSVRTSNWRLRTEIKSAGNVILPAGAFVKPVLDYHLPKDKKEEMGRIREIMTDVVCCYTAVGWVTISWDDLEET